MNPLWSRRHALASFAACAAIASPGPVWAQPASFDQGLLARLRQAGKVRVGIANQPPFSGLDPDGSLTGLAPTLTKTIMSQLGVPAVEGIVATYGELVPGMQAGRWDFIAAALTITKQRCAQVLFSDPVLFDGGAFVSLKGQLANPPKLVDDLAKQKLTVGVQTGGAHARVALKAGVSPANLRQFSSDVSTIDGLLAKRIDVAFGSSSGLTNATRRRSIDVIFTYPIADDPAHASGCAFRTGDGDLRAAFDERLRAMKASGEYRKLADPFGFEAPPDLLTLTSQKICAEGA